MKLWLDTASVTEIREADSWGVLSGVTTNPTLAGKEGRTNFRELVQEICSIVDGPVSAEVTALKADEMIREAREIATWAPNVVVKIPITPDGLKAIHAVSADGIKVNTTLIFSANQGLLAARAGAAFVSPFVGRLDDINEDGMKSVRELVEIFAIHDIACEVIAASIRNPLHVTAAALAGSHICTMPFKVMQQMVEHPLTDKGIERFLADWKKAGLTVLSGPGSPAATPVR